MFNLNNTIKIRLLLIYYVFVINPTSTIAAVELKSTIAAVELIYDSTKEVKIGVP